MDYFAGLDIANWVAGARVEAAELARQINRGIGLVPRWGSRQDQDLSAYGKQGRELLLQDFERGWLPNLEETARYILGNKQRSGALWWNWKRNKQDAIRKAAQAAQASSLPWAPRKWWRAKSSYGHRYKAYHGSKRSAYPASYGRKAWGRRKRRFRHRFSKY